jgi:hypothetical protein
MISKERFIKRIALEMSWEVLEFLTSESLGSFKKSITSNKNSTKYSFGKLV